MIVQVVQECNDNDINAKFTFYTGNRNLVVAAKPEIL